MSTRRCRRSMLRHPRSWWPSLAAHARPDRRRCRRHDRRHGQSRRGSPRTPTPSSTFCRRPGRSRRRRSRPRWTSGSMKFAPHVLPIVAGTTVRFLNSDPTQHNVFSPDYEKYNLGTWPQGQTKDHVFAKCAKAPCVYVQLCRIHPEMEAYVVVLQNPFFAVTAADGQYKIDNVPPGSYSLGVWHAKGKAQPKAADRRRRETSRRSTSPSALNGHAPCVRLAVLLDRRALLWSPCASPALRRRAGGRTERVDSVQTCHGRRRVPSTLHHLGLTIERSSMGWDGQWGSMPLAHSAPDAPDTGRQPSGGAFVLSGADLYRISCRACHKPDGTRRAARDQFAPWTGAVGLRALDDRANEGDAAAPPTRHSSASSRPHRSRSAEAAPSQAGTTCRRSIISRTKKSRCCGPIWTSWRACRGRGRAAVDQDRPPIASASSSSKARATSATTPRAVERADDGPERRHSVAGEAAASTAQRPIRPEGSSRHGCSARERKRDVARPDAGVQLPERGRGRRNLFVPVIPTRDRTQRTMIQVSRGRGRDGIRTHSQSPDDCAPGDNARRIR